MRFKLGFAAAVAGLACISAAEAPSNYQTYGGVRADADPLLLHTYNVALNHCTGEASTPPRGTPYPTSLYYNAALRACLYRRGFTDRGSQAYPATLVFDHFLAL